MSTIGENIKKRRLELKMSQQTLADLLGYKSKSTITKIEKNETEPTHSKLLAMANVLNTGIDYILTGRTDESNKNIILEKQAVCGRTSDEGSSSSKVIAVILAGGLSTRNHQNTPNQFVNVAGKPVIMYAMQAYQRHPAVDEIYVVCLSGWEDIVSAYARNFSVTKLRGIIPAGTTGALSVKAAAEWLSSRCSFGDIVIFQESTRPMVSEEMISNVIRCTKEHDSAVTFEPMDEYIQFIKRNDSGVDYVDRSKLLSIQSPEAYSYGKLFRTFGEGEKINHEFNETCCAMVMYNLGKKLVFCEGSRYNIKIVRQEDIKFVEALLEISK